MASSSAKTVSNATMGLRFMQNARRAKEEEQVRLQQAKVKDEAEWEVDARVRESWGLKESSEGSSLSAVTQEPSYLPFLFPSLQRPATEEKPEPSTPPHRFRGRRKFNNSGTEVVQQTAENKSPVVTEHGSPDAESAKPKHLLSISGYSRGSSKSEYIDGKPRRREAKEKISVLKLLSEETSQSVGTDLRSSRKNQQLSDDISAGGTTNKATPLDTDPASASDHVLNSTKASCTPAVVMKAKAAALTFKRPAGVDSPLSQSAKLSADKRDRVDGRSDDGVSIPKDPSATVGDSEKRKKKRRKIAGDKEKAVRNPSS